MNVDEAIKKIGEITEKALAKDENALTWDMEINIKQSIVNNLNLEKFFKDKVELENMYTYEMFSEKRKIPYKTKVEMVKRWIKYLNAMSDVKVNIDPDKIK
jgi:hypothetical protein